MRHATTSLSYRIAQKRDDACGVDAQNFAQDFAQDSVQELVVALKPLVAPRRLLFLQGALGTGKTLVARALIQALTEEETVVPSPTFAILQPYQTKSCSVLHADLYRLRSEQTWDLGLEEALQTSFVMIEWAERLPAALRARMLEQAVLLRLRLDDDTDSAEPSAVLTLPQSLARDFAQSFAQSFASKNYCALPEAEAGEGKGEGAVSTRRRFSSPASATITRAFVLAAGLGSRLRSYAQKPKPLVRVGGKPLLLHAIERLHAQGVRQIFVNAHYCADAIVKACEGLAGVTVLREPVLLETGGGIERALPLLGEQPFFALNADALWYDPPAKAAASDTPSLLACLAEGWQRLVSKKPEASALLALIEQRGAKDMQAKDTLARDTIESIESCEPFPLVFPVPTSEHEEETRACSSFLAFRYIGVQVLTARAFRSFRASHPHPMSPPSMPYSLTEIYAQESKESRLFGLALDKRWRGRWLHSGDRAGLLQARRAWRKLGTQK